MCQLETCQRRWTAKRGHISGRGCIPPARSLGSWMHGQKTAVNGKHLSRKEKQKPMLSRNGSNVPTKGYRHSQCLRGIEMMQWRALAILKPHGRSLHNAATFFVKHLQVAKNDKIVPDLVDELLASKSKDGASLRYLKDLRTRLNIFAGVFPETKIGELSTPVIDDWLRDLPHSAVTRNNYRRLLGVLFSYALQRGYCLENPIGRTSRAKVVDKPPGILNPDECSALLTNAKDEILPAIALGLFAGLRPEAEIWRLGWGDIDFESGLIQIEAAKTKSARHRLVEMTDNLTQWLAPYRRTGPVSPTGDKYNYLLQAARGASGLTEWPQDCLRHCYGTYHYAKFQNPGKTMVQMGHTNPRTFHAHYRARVTPKDAARYWNIMPSGARKEKVVASAAS